MCSFLSPSAQSSFEQFLNLPFFVPVYAERHCHAECGANKIVNFVLISKTIMCMKVFNYCSKIHLDSETSIITEVFEILIRSSNLLYIQYFSNFSPVYKHKYFCI